MGANRKRLANQMSPDGGDERTDKKTKKKKDKKRGSKNKDVGKLGKGSKSNKESSSSTGNSLAATATAEGKQMAQVLSTFSKLEQSRFEAFRTSAFDGDAIAKYVAHCLIHEQHRPVSVGSESALPAATVRTKITGANSGPTDRDGKAKARFRNLRPNTHYQRRLILSELVAPGQAQDITVVVSTLAKEYAQRLVLAARRHAAERLAKVNESDEVPEDAAISPDDLLRAYTDRQARGLDPGFFLQKSQTDDARATETSLFLTDPDNQQRYSLSRSVALAAQEEYDREQKEEINAEENDESEDGEAMKLENDADGDVEMIEDEQKSEEKETGEEEKSEHDFGEYEVDEVEDPSEQAMRLFSLHVNRLIARQNGITVVTSDDEDASKTETKEPPQTPSSAAEGEEAPNTEGKDEAGQPSITSAPTTTSSTMENEETKSSSTEQIQPISPSSSTPDIEATATSTPVDISSESKEPDEVVPMDTSTDAVTSSSTPQEGEGVEATNDGDGAMDTTTEATAEQVEQPKQPAQETPEEPVSSPPSNSETNDAADTSNSASQEDAQGEENATASAESQEPDSSADGKASDGQSGETEEAKNE